MLHILSYFHTIIPLRIAKERPRDTPFEQNHPSQHTVIYNKIELYRTGLRTKPSPADRTVAERLKAARLARCSRTNGTPERGDSAMERGDSMPAIRDWQRPKVWGLQRAGAGSSDIVQRPCGFLRHEGVPGFAGVQTVSVQGVKILPAVEGRRD